MTKSSTVTIRDTPLPETASAQDGRLAIHGELLIVQTGARVQLVDLTDRIAAFVSGCGVREGTLHVWSMHTTCALLINEYQAALVADITRLLEALIARDGEWRHNDPAHSDCDRMNADAHLRAMLLGHGLTLQISAGEVVLGHWQRVLLAELDGPRDRRVRVQAWGLAG